MTTEELLNEMWELYPQGNRELFVQYAINATDDVNPIYVDGVKLSISILLEKYRQYIKWWTYTYGKQETRYIPSKDRKKTPEQFVLGAEYLNSRVMSSSNPNRDLYVFGPHSKASLHNQLAKFKNTYTNYVGRYQQHQSTRIQIQKNESPF